MPCEYCGQEAIFRCSVCRRIVCGEHAKLATLCPSCKKKEYARYSVGEPTTQTGQERVREFVRRFWGEEVQRTFDRDFEVSKLPMYTAKSRNDVIGFISFSECEDAVLIVTLGVLPSYQNAGVGKALVKKVEAHAKKTRKKRLVLSTSNDDLPALAFYQSIGFQIYEVKPNMIAEKHGKTVKGIYGLPVRDELRLQKVLE